MGGPTFLKHLCTGKDLNSHSKANQSVLSPKLQSPICSMISDTHTSPPLFPLYTLADTFTLFSCICVGGLFVHVYTNVETTGSQQVFNHHLGFEPRAPSLARLTLMPEGPLVTALYPSGCA